MKVMLVIPHLSDGGAEKVLSELSLDLGLGELVLVVFQEKVRYPFKGRLISLDIPIQQQSIFGRAFGFIRRSYRFRRILQQERPDVVVSFMGEANFINALLSPRPILTVHNHLSSTSKLRGKTEAFAFNVLLRLLYRRATVVAVSEAVKRDLVENFGLPANRIVVITNAVNIHEIQGLSAEDVTCPWNPSLPVVITAGRLHPQKGQWHLLRAFAEVRRKMECQLAILGTGDLEDYLRRLAAELGIDNDVYFLGWQKNPFKFMAKADLFVLSSVTEGFGLVLLEAMACRLPVIATDCPGSSKEIIAPGGEEYGILVSAAGDKMYSGLEPCTGEELELAGAILRMLRDTKLRQRYIEAGLVRIRDFDRATFVEKYRRLICSSVPQSTKTAL